MKPLKAVQIAIELAQRRRDDAAKVLAVAVQNQQAAQGQLDQLQAYARETDDKWINRAQVSASPALMQHHYQFMAKLDQAMVFQHSVIQNHVHRVSQLRQALVDADQRLGSFEHVLASRKAAIGVVMNRREQRETDELASRMGTQRNRRIGEEESQWLSN
jgi:flagellar FliJ protein